MSKKNESSPVSNIISRNPRHLWRRMKGRKARVAGSLKMGFLHTFIITFTRNEIITAPTFPGSGYDPAFSISISALPFSRTRGTCRELLAEKVKLKSFVTRGNSTKFQFVSFALRVGAPDSLLLPGTKFDFFFNSAKDSSFT